VKAAINVSHSLTHRVSEATGGPRKSKERRVGCRRPLGTVAVLARLMGSEELNRLDVLLMDASDQGVGLRSPIGLARGGIYRLRIGSARNAVMPSKTDERLFRSAPAEAACYLCLIRITRCRRREDGRFDVGGHYVGTPTGWSG
jgi:hypothetical protein